MVKARKGRSGSRPDASSGRRPVYEDLSFHAQQAAEKAIKAAYVKLGMRFPYTHDIAELLSNLTRSSVHLVGLTVGSLFFLGSRQKTPLKPRFLGMAGGGSFGCVRRR